MFSFSAIEKIADYILFFSCLVILIGSLLITIKTRFVQLRFLPVIFRMLKSSLAKDNSTDANTVLPHRALFTAMSTTLGISTIVAPVIAISLGGPGALFGFLLTSFLGSAATYIEVNLSIRHRKKLGSGKIMGGPMQYLQQILSAGVAKWYALGSLVLMTAWSGAQANQLAAILDSPLLGEWRLPTMVSGVVIAVVVFLTLLGGIRRIGALSAKMVPIMFVLYIGSSLWILLCNMDRLGEIFGMMVQGALSPYPLANGALVGGIVSALRWGVFKGTQSCEAGIGTQTIPHSMAETKDPEAQGALSMLSTYAAGLVAFLSGCVALITNTWQDPGLPLGISMVAASYQAYFSYAGIAIVAISTLLFGFGTILGNSYNGSQCFVYLLGHKKIRYYFVGMVVMIFLGSIGEVKMVWSLVDLVLASIALPHIAALVLHVYKKPKAVEV